MNQSLKNKVVIVTGASSGIGEATVQALAEKGARVAAVARRKEKLDKLEKKYKNNVFPIVADISKEAEAKKVVDQTVQKWERLDVLVANAGVMLLSPIRESKIEEWKQMVDVNILGLMYCIYYGLPHMTQQKSGHIISISSVAGRIVFAHGAVYCATKYAVRAFSEALRQEVCQDNIRVTTIEPGAVKTELADHISHGGSKNFIDQFLSSMEALQSEDIASSIIYALEQPAHVDVSEILIRPTAQVL